jgi:hypothetical protein
MKTKTIAIAAIAALAAISLVSCEKAGAAGGKPAPSKEQVAKTVTDTSTSAIVLVTIADEVRVSHLQPADLKLAIWNSLNSEKKGFEPDFSSFSITGKTVSGNDFTDTQTGKYVIMTAKGDLISSNDSEMAKSVIASYKEAMFPTPSVATVTTAPATPATAPAPAPAPAAAPAVAPEKPAPATPPTGNASLADQIKSQLAAAGKQ